MHNKVPGTEQVEEARDAAGVLSTTLNMIVRDYDRKHPAEIRKLASFAKYEADRLLEALNRMLSVAA